MNETGQEPFETSQARNRSWRKMLLAGLGLAILGGILLLLLIFFQRPPSPISLALGDGRVLQIESVSYGTKHRIGRTPLFKKFQPWLPVRLAGYFAPSLREDEITLDRPGLVVWVSAVSELGKTNVDCQGIRVEFLDRNGDLFGETTSAWHGWYDVLADGSCLLLFSTGGTRFDPARHAMVKGPIGGSRSGWTGMSQQITPFKRKVTRNHYTPVPVIYLHVGNDASDPFDGNRGSQSESPERFAVRLRDDQGNYWATKPEGGANGIEPFLVDLPSSVTNIVPEILLLKPVQAEFIVNTK